MSQLIMKNSITANCHLHELTSLSKLGINALDMMNISQNRAEKD